MIKSYNFMCKTSIIKYFILEKFKKHRFVLISLIFFAIVGLLTGVFVALKCGVTLATLSDYNLDSYTCSQINSFSNFMTRFFSCGCNMALLCVSATFVFIIPVGYILTAYRMYLAGFNCTLLASLYGFTGALNSILIILPCQIFISVILILYFIAMISAFKEKKKYGAKPKIIKNFLLFFIILCVLCLIETFLLTIFSAKVIFVI